MQTSSTLAVPTCKWEMKTVPLSVQRQVASLTQQAKVPCLKQGRKGKNQHREASFNIHMRTAAPTHAHIYIQTHSNEKKYV